MVMVNSASDWFEEGGHPEVENIYSALCFGCQRLCIETPVNKRVTFLASLPDVVLQNARLVIEE